MTDEKDKKIEEHEKTIEQLQQQLHDRTGNDIAARDRIDELEMHNRELQHKRNVAEEKLKSVHN